MNTYSIRINKKINSYLLTPLPLPIGFYAAFGEFYTVYKYYDSATVVRV